MRHSLCELYKYEQIYHTKHIFPPQFNQKTANTGMLKNSTLWGKAKLQMSLNKVIHATNYGQFKDTWVGREKMGNEEEGMF